MKTEKCHVEGCESTETLLDNDGVTWLCQKHLAEKIFGKKSIKIKLQRNDPCPCKSGKKLKNCCMSNPLKMWFLNRVGTRIYYFDSMCDKPLCDSCQQGRTGIVIRNAEHAIQLYEFARANDDRIEFTNINPNEEKKDKGVNPKGDKE